MAVIGHCGELPEEGETVKLEKESNYIGKY